MQQDFRGNLIIPAYCHKAITNALAQGNAWDCLKRLDSLAAGSPTLRLPAGLHPRRSSLGLGCDLSKEQRDVSRPLENIDSSGRLRQRGQHMGPRVAGPVPDPLQEAPVEPFRTARSHIMTHFPVRLGDAQQDAREAAPTRKVQEYDRVGRCDPDPKRSAEIAVDDPCRALSKLLHARLPLVFASFLPPRKPVLTVEMDQGKPGLRSQFSGQSGLARAGASDHNNALHVQAGRKSPASKSEIRTIPLPARFSAPPSPRSITQRACEIAAPSFRRSAADEPIWPPVVTTSSTSRTCFPDTAAPSHKRAVPYGFAALRTNAVGIPE